mmetsp:Transcript_47730/g.123775  ORF Transcript_47730/g.123775 Transcript_47730/m.123775 type:complete len:128 (-) Transcript_47730:416-799(-)
MEFPFGKGGQANNFPSFSELGFNEREIALDLDGDSAIEKANDTIFVLSTANKDASFYSPKVSQQSPPAMSPSPSRLPSIYSPSVRDESGEGMKGLAFPRSALMKPQQSLKYAWQTCTILFTKKPRMT